MLLAFVHTASVAKLLKSRKWRWFFEKNLYSEALEEA